MLPVSAKLFDAGLKKVANLRYHAEAHSAGEAQILPNLRVLTGGTEYGRPRVQRMINLP